MKAPEILFEVTIKNLDTKMTQQIHVVGDFYMDLKERIEKAILGGREGYQIVEIKTVGEIEAHI